MLYVNLKLKTFIILEIKDWKFGDPVANMRYAEFPVLVTAVRDYSQRFPGRIEFSISLYKTITKIKYTFEFMHGYYIL